MSGGPLGDQLADLPKDQQADGGLIQTCSRLLRLPVDGGGIFVLMSSVWRRVHRRPSPGSRRPMRTFAPPAGSASACRAVGRRSKRTIHQCWSSRAITEPLPSSAPSSVTPWPASPTN